jgi:hypothetical protein
MVWHNLDLLNAILKDDKIERKWEAMANLIDRSLPKADIYRVHVGGDFFNYNYLVAWTVVARRYPERIFYAYTKSLHLFYSKDGSTGQHEVPSNMRFTASRGGFHDWLITEHDLKCAEVVFSEEEADAQQLEIDHDDEHAAFGRESFALLLHGVQPKGSGASQALSEIKRRAKQS